jgi:hypothetical protein
MRQSFAEESFSESLDLRCERCGVSLREGGRPDDTCANECDGSGQENGITEAGKRSVASRYRRFPECVDTIRERAAARQAQRMQGRPL